VQLRLGRSNRRSAVWRLAGGSSPRRANFLQLVSRAMVRLDLEALRKITWRFEGYASRRRRATCDRYEADTMQGGTWLRLRSQRVDVRSTTARVSSQLCTCVIINVRAEEDIAGGLARLLSVGSRSIGRTLGIQTWRWLELEASESTVKLSGDALGGVVACMDRSGRGTELLRRSGQSSLWKIRS
jgi:hypothetical protein